MVFLKPELVTPYSDGSPREQQAASVATGQLDRIPYMPSRLLKPRAVLIAIAPITIRDAESTEVPASRS
jgi:hypothetical protein